MMQANVFITHPLSEYDTATAVYAGTSTDESVRETQNHVTIAGVSFIWNAKRSYEEVLADLSTMRDVLDDARTELRRAHMAESKQVSLVKA